MSIKGNGLNLDKGGHTSPVTEMNRKEVRGVSKSTDNIIEMSHSERRDIKKLVETRFELLEEELRQRRDEIEPIIQARIESQYEKSITQMVREAKKLDVAHQKLTERAQELNEKARTVVTAMTTSLVTTPLSGCPRPSRGRSRRKWVYS
jgi:hypothetical protein